MSAEAQLVDKASNGQAEGHHALFEPLILILLSLATVGTAWCSFQAAAWSGRAQSLSNLSTDASRRAAAAQLQFQQVALLDVLLFSQHINARAASNDLLARFYSERFRGEAKTAFEAWMATQPYDNVNAAPHPFVTNLYKPRLLEDSRQAEMRGQQFWQQAGDAGRTSRSYVLITVLLASALFFGGTASKMGSRWLRRAVLMLGLLVFTIAAERLLWLPVQL